MEVTPAIDVSILVVSYNTAALTLAALDSIYRETQGVRFEVIVVDNASSDGSAAAIAAHPYRPKLIALEKNIGFGRANNLAAKHAQGSLLLLINPDTVVQDAAVDRLVSFAHHNPHAQIWGGRTVFADGRLNPSSCWRQMTLWTLLCQASGLTAIARNSAVFNSEAYGGWKRDTVREVDIVSGCFFLIDRSLWEGLDGFDPLFFMYGEEADLCLRARRMGAHPVIVPRATIVHYGGASEPVRADKMVRLLAAKAALIDRHFPRVFRKLGQVLLAAWPLSRVIALSVASFAFSDARMKERAASWTEVWRRRGEWRRGWIANRTEHGQRWSGRCACR